MGASYDLIIDNGILPKLHRGDLSNCFKRSERIIDELNFYKLFFSYTKYDFGCAYFITYELI